MTNFRISKVQQALGIMLFAVLAMTITAKAQDDGDSKSVDIQTDTDGFSVVFMADTTRDLLSFSVRIVGPENYLFKNRKELGTLLKWAPPMDLADGGYAWEARVVTADPGAGMRESMEGLRPDARIEQLFEPEVQQTHVASGTFRFEGGFLQQPRPQGEDGDVPVARRVAQAIVDFFFPSAHAQLRLRSDGNAGVNALSSNARFMVQSDDEEYALRVQVGGATTRFSVTDNGGTGIGDFWASTSIPERGLRVFGDTELDSNLAVAGDLSIGGSFSGVADFSSNTFISGNLGVGTDIASRRITSNSGSCQYRLEDSSSDSTYQLCAGQGANGGFEILGSNSGSTAPRPFRVDGDAPTDSLVVSPIGLGVGTLAPAAPMHVVRNDDTFEFLLLDQQNASVIQDRNMIQLNNNGGIRFQFDNEALATSWRFQAATGLQDVFEIAKVGTGIIEMTIDANGNLTTAGTVNGASSRAVKNSIEPVDDHDVLRRLRNLPVAEWTYNRDPDGLRHLGPMAEDFYSAFGLGVDDKHISPSDLAGVALAATKALIVENEQQQDRIQAQEKRINELESQNQVIRSSLVELRELRVEVEQLKASWPSVRVALEN